MKRLIFALSLFLVPAAAAQTMTGTLAPGDAQREDGVFYDMIPLVIDSPSYVTIRMESTAFDTYLIVKSPSGEETSNDDFDGQSVSQVDLMAFEPGRWTIWATAYGNGMTGDYTVEITTGTSLAVETIEGRLDPRDAVALKGEYFDTIVRDLKGGVSYMFQLISMGFDGYLVVESPDGITQRNDDSGSTSVSRIGPVSGSGGKWTIRVSSAMEGEQGAYDLNIVTMRDP